MDNALFSLPPKLKLGPQVTFERSESSLQVFSPALREVIEIGKDLEDLLGALAKPQPVELIVLEWLSRRKMGSDTRITEQVNSALLALVGHGILVEARTLDFAEAGSLIVSEIDEACKNTFAATSGAYYTMNLTTYGTLHPDPVSDLGRDFHVCRRPDGQLVLFDGADAALAQWQTTGTLDVLVLPREAYLWHAADAPNDFFGTQRVQYPYQGLYLDGLPLVKGIRMDLKERLDMLCHQDIAGKHILDLGCNYGMNCFLAVERGAQSALGVEYSKNLVKSALRLNAFYGRPCDFLSWDLNQPAPVPDTIDTAFFFATIGHLKSVDGVFETLHASGASVVYLETHCDEQTQGELSKFLAWDRFVEVKFLGHSSDNNFDQTRTREMYRCRLG